MNPDILKVITVLAAFYYLNRRVRPEVKPVNYRIMTVGLGLLLFASVMDFVDGFESLNNFALFGRDAILHDLLEDQFGDTIGLLLFALGAFKGILEKRQNQN